ncbi:MAG: glutamine-hydrolyzing carbamoyl-phosphate synthase small subunit [Spirochaetales bacterium]|nr:glutamine-hydrolyzing carbamoyl-phosphate synthase small subunit [Spirochaetales bacterium]
MKAILALEDGTIFYGTSFGAQGETDGEVVFNTSMTGYQEILTDPSYKGQIVTMTYPLIGNYGVNKEDIESCKIQAQGLIIKELCRYPSNYRSKQNLEDYLKEQGVMGIEGIDTRALTKHIRVIGAMKGYLSTNDLDEKRCIQKAKDSTGLVGIDLVKEVTCKEPYEWDPEDKEKKAYKVVAMDLGIKYNILRMLSGLGCHVTVVPASTDPATILAYKPDGLFLSNGPGDPAGIPYVAQTVRELLGKLPIFGICMGHQVLGMAFGGKTYKLKFGHRGANHPVKDIAQGSIAITSQNHGFCVDMESIGNDDVTLTHINLNDRTPEGLEHTSFPAFSVQYHPEASPGPHDATYLFKKFIAMMKT